MAACDNRSAVDMNSHIRINAGISAETDVAAYRMRELKVLTSKEIKTFIKENNIKLCSFKDVI